MDRISDIALDQARQLGTRMLGAADAGDWANAATLHAECDALIRRDHTSGDAARAALLELQRQHQRVATLAGQARDAIAQELGRHRHNHRALHAYLVSCEE